MEVSFSPRDTAYSDTYVTLTKCLYSTIEAMIMSLATKNNVSTGYFSCSGSKNERWEGSAVGGRQQERAAVCLGEGLGSGGAQELRGGGGALYHGHQRNWKRDRENAEGMEMRKREGESMETIAHSQPLTRKEI
jgi:hypothetical protein